ncbi:MAG: MbnP family protein [Deltaproteobacteria bacterium]
MSTCRRSCLALPFTALTMILAAGSAACGPTINPVDVSPSDASGDATPLGNITIAFAHTVHGVPLMLGTATPYTNAAGNSFGVTRVSYFVSNLTLNLRDGRSVSAPGAHYVDVDTPTTMRLAFPGDVPTGDLASISFVMGLPPALDVTGMFSSPPESLMEWPVMMGGGYHHMKFEGRYVNSAGQPYGFMAHSGGLDYVDYSFPVTLDAAGRTMTGSAVTFTLQMDLAEWFTNPSTWDLNDYFNATHPGIMDDAVALASLRANGASVFSLGAP